MLFFCGISNRLVVILAVVLRLFFYAFDFTRLIHGSGPCILCAWRRGGAVDIRVIGLRGGAGVREEFK